MRRQREPSRWAMEPCPHRRIGVGLSLVLLALCTPALEAQTVRGRVVDGATGSGIPQATVAVIADGRTVTGSLTDDAGSFSINVSDPGRYLIRASGQGYFTLTLDEVDLQPRQTLDLPELRLEADPIALDAITVEARRSRARLRGEDRVRLRQLVGEGTFIPGAMLVVENPSSLTAYLAEKADLHVRYDFYGFPYLWSPVGPYHCLITQVNHWPMSALGYRSLDEINFRRIAAIEIYNTAAQVPQESQLLRDIEDDRRCPCGRCGLVNVWYWSSW